MKMSEATEIMERGLKRPGYMVRFEHAGDGFLTGDHFPDKHAGEDLIETEDQAWFLAKQFASKTWGRCVNIYVIDSTFCPVPDYQQRRIVNR